MAEIQILVRYFAGAYAAAGTREEHVRLPAGADVAALSDALSQRHGAGLTRLLAASTFLVGAVSAGPQQVLADGAQVDVLPPFAGG